MIVIDAAWKRFERFEARRRLRIVEGDTDGATLHTDCKALRAQGDRGALRPPYEIDVRICLTAVLFEVQQPNHIKVGFRR